MARTRPDFLSPPPDAAATPDADMPDTAPDTAPDAAPDAAGDAPPARAAGDTGAAAPDTARARADARRAADVAATRTADAAPAVRDADTAASPKPEQPKPAGWGEILAGLAAIPAYMAGSTVRTIWRSALEAPTYWTVRGWFKLVGGSLNALGLPHKWTDEWIMKTPPWKKRDEPPFVGPLMHLFGAMKRGRTWGEAKPKKDKQSVKGGK